jgi:hypothetical protein
VHRNFRIGTLGAGKQRDKTTPKTYRDVAIDQMVATVEEAMSHVIDWWGDLPTPMNEALDTPVPEASWKAAEQR